jgi:D-aminopeptidase
VHPDTLQTEYVSLRIQNATIGSVTYGMNALGPVQPLKKQAHPTIEVQFQQDARAITPRPKPFNEWVDDVTLTYQ